MIPLRPFLLTHVFTYLSALFTQYIYITIGLFKIHWGVCLWLSLKVSPMYISYRNPTFAAMPACFLPRGLKSARFLIDVNNGLPSNRDGLFIIAVNLFWFGDVDGLFISARFVLIFVGVPVGVFVPAAVGFFVGVLDFGDFFSAGCSGYFEEEDVLPADDDDALSWRFSWPPVLRRSSTDRGKEGGCLGFGLVLNVCDRG